MTLIDRLPSQGIVDGYRGIIDFYCIGHAWVARKWPRPPTGPRAPDVQAQYAAFAYVNQQAAYLSPSVILAFRSMVVGSRLTWKDLYVRSYIAGNIIQSELLP